MSKKNITNGDGEVIGTASFTERQFKNDRGETETEQVADFTLVANPPEDLNPQQIVPGK